MGPLHVGVDAVKPKDVEKVLQQAANIGRPVQSRIELYASIAGDASLPRPARAEASAKALMLELHARAQHGSEPPGRKPTPRPEPTATQRFDEPTPASLVVRLFDACALLKPSEADWFFGLAAAAFPYLARIGDRDASVKLFWIFTTFQTDATGWADDVARLIPECADDDRVRALLLQGTTD